VAGLNLAIVYGFALIVVAFALALVYGMLCRNEPVDEPGDVDSSGREGDAP
jgi:hypothetical protein